MGQGKKGKRAIEHGAPGQAYTIADDRAMSFGDYLTATAQAFGLPRPIRVPAGVLRPMPLLYAMLHTNLLVDTAKARRALGWSPLFPTVADGLAAAATQEMRS